jgi:hypothetical protein
MRDARLTHKPKSCCRGGCGTQLTCLCVCVWEPNGIKIEQKLSLKIAIHTCPQPVIADFFLYAFDDQVDMIECQRVCCNFQQRLKTNPVCVCHFVSAKNLLLHLLSSCLQFTPQLTNLCKRKCKRVKFCLKHNMVRECGVVWNGM